MTGELQVKRRKGRSACPKMSCAASGVLLRPRAQVAALKSFHQAASFPEEGPRSARPPTPPPTPQLQQLPESVPRLPLSKRRSAAGRGLGPVAEAQRRARSWGWVAVGRGAAEALGAARRGRAAPGTPAGVALSPAASPAPAGCPRTVAAQTPVVQRRAASANRGPDAPGEEGAGRLRPQGGRRTPPSRPDRRRPEPRAGPWAARWSPPEPRRRAAPRTPSRAPRPWRREEVRAQAGRTLRAAGTRNQARCSEPAPARRPEGHPQMRNLPGRRGGPGTEKTLPEQCTRPRHPGRLRGEPSAGQGLPASPVSGGSGTSSRRG